jgi:hypothetical protein
LQSKVRRAKARRCLPDDVKIDAALLYPLAERQQALFPLQNVDAVLAEFTEAIALAQRNIEAGLLLPGVDADNKYNECAFALPANAGYLARKMPLASEKLGEATKIWEPQ